MNLCWDIGKSPSRGAGHGTNPQEAEVAGAEELASNNVRNRWADMIIPFSIRTPGTLMASS
jgi:hypothetical protein